MQPYILSVDDEAEITSLISFHLKKQGYAVATAASGREALESVARRRPDLILLDLMLPDIDGFGVCEILHRGPETATIPIVILSAWSDPESYHVGLDLGAIDFLAKPFSPRSLLARVNELMRHNEPAPFPRA